MKQYWSEKARSLTPYTAGEQPKEDFIKLNTNENAYPPSPAALRAIGEASASLRLYPRPDSDGLREAAAKRHGLSPGQVFCANGSDEALALCFQAFFDPGVPVVTMDVTYSFYPVWARLYGLTLQTVPLRGDYTADVAGMTGCRSAVIANPNAPTGIALPARDLERIIRGADGVVVVDEAYVGFGGESVAPLVGKYKNLAVVRTLSKSHSLAGLRVGYAVADENLIAALRAVKDSFNSYPLDTPAQAGGAAALADTAYYAETAEKIMRDREYTAQALREMGFSVLPSAANFIFVRCRDASAAFAALRQRGILVRYFPTERTRDFLRVTIGTREQMDAFIRAMREIGNAQERG